MDFLEQKKILSELEQMKLKYNTLYIEYETKYNAQIKVLEEMCKHEWVKDTDTFDFHSHHICKHCNKYR